MAGTTLILGLGKTGLSCARYLAAQGVTLRIADSRPNPPGLSALRAELPQVPVSLGGFDPADFEAADRLVISPGVPRSEPLVAQAEARGIEVIGDIELFARAVRAPVLAITGSNGKSTVTTLVGDMVRANGLRVAVGGNLGQPALDLLDPSVACYVLELSSFQLESTHSLRPQVASVLNLSADHLDRYPSFSDYGAAKARILAGAAIGILNRDDPQVRNLAGIAHRDRWFHLAPPSDPWEYGLLARAGSPWLARGTEPLVPVSELRLVGRHQLANALAALGIAEAFGLDRDASLAALRAFSGLPHRSQRVGIRRGVEWINDSKATNPGATMAALSGLADGRGRLFLIAGGLAKGADFRALGDAIARRVRGVILLGRDAPYIEAAIRGRTAVESVDSLESAVHLAARWARPGDRVLLSPACASFDLFEDFEHRGRVFTDAVLRLED